jgi:hypothetical protein
VNGTFIHLCAVWENRNIFRRTKLWLLSSIVKLVLRMAVKNGKS